MFPLTLSHVGIHVRDIPRVVDFYTRFLGLAVADRGPNPNGEIVFPQAGAERRHLQTA